MKQISLLLIFFLPFLLLSYENHVHENTNCIGKLTFKKITECVLDHSPEFRLAKLELKAIQGKKQIASYYFPSNPIVSAMSSYRKQTISESPLDPSLNRAVNGELSISQEIYIGGQRSTKQEIVDSEYKSQYNKVKSIERETIFQSLIASTLYKNSIDEYKLILDLYELHKDIYLITKTRAEKGLIANIDADIALAEQIKMNRMVQIANRKLQSNKANLTVMMGVDFESSIEIIDTLPEIKFYKNELNRILEFALKNRTDVIASEYDTKTTEKIISLLKKERIPNLTISGFVQRDGFNENVVGGRFSLPLNIWRDNKGEIAVANSKNQQSIAFAEVNRHTIRFEVIKSFITYHSFKEELENYTDSILKNTEKNLKNIKSAISLGQVNMKDAIFGQQSMVNLKLNYMQTLLDYSLAKIELIRASGLDFFSESP